MYVIENIIDRIPLSLSLILIGLVCFLLSKVMILSINRLDKKIKRLNDVIYKYYGFKS